MDRASEMDASAARGDVMSIGREMPIPKPSAAIPCFVVTAVVLFLFFSP